MDHAGAPKFSGFAHGQMPGPTQQSLPSGRVTSHCPSRTSRPSAVRFYCLGGGRAGTRAAPLLASASPIYSPRAPGSLRRARRALGLPALDALLQSEFVESPPCVRMCVDAWKPGLTGRDFWPVLEAGGERSRLFLPTSNQSLGCPLVNIARTDGQDLLNRRAGYVVPGPLARAGGAGSV